MFIFAAVIHILVSITLVLFVLLQNPKGGALGMLGGQSSSKSVFGSTGAGDFFASVTKWCAVVFAVTSIHLAYMSSKKEESLILDQNISQPAKEASEAPAAPPEKPPSSDKPQSSPAESKK